MRTIASYTAMSPCGWNLPITSPTMRADLLERRVVAIAHLAHGVEDAPLHRLLPVLDARQRAALHHAHRVGEVGARGEFGEATGPRGRTAAPLLPASPGARAVGRTGRPRDPRPGAPSSRFAFTVLTGRPRSCALPSPSRRAGRPLRVLPMSSLNTGGAAACSAGSRRISISRRVSGFIVVSHNWSGFISPRPLKRPTWIEASRRPSSRSFSRIWSRSRSSSA